MDRVYEELDEAKAEIEKLKAECRIKSELSNSLKRAHSEQLIKIQETGLKIEKQAQEVNEKEEEMSVAKQMCEDLKRSLNEKESIIKRLNSANDKLRFDCNEKLRKWEEENRVLVLALDEANEKSKDQELKICAFKEEIEGLKALVSASQKKCLEAEQKARAVKELKQRDDMLLSLEEENRKVEDQLKWKKEQFKHLEEAHKNLQDQFRASKKEWELEKSTLLDEISTLQTSLDSQTRISEGLQSRLQMCNQALAHEESRRKYLEVQVFESKTSFENTFAECQEAKSKIKCLTSQRDKEIAALRNLLGTKETLYKEMEFKVGKLEQENQELLISLKELQEAGIHKAGTSSSLAKLRNKLKGLERMHKDCSTNLRTKEAEWSSQLEKLTGDLNDYRSELKSKDTAINELKMELEGCHSLIMQLKLQNEEISVMLLVLKSGFSEVQLRYANEKAEMDLQNKEREENVCHLMKQLEMKNTALIKAQTDIEEEREKAASLLRTVEPLDLVEQQQLLMQKELERHKKMLDESSSYQLGLKEQALQMESDLKKELQEACDALDRANSELAEKVCEGSELEFELQIWKSVAERLRVHLEESQEMRREIEASLLAQVEVEETLKQENESLIRVLEEKERKIDDLQQQNVSLDQELKTREMKTPSPARMEKAIAFESEKESFLQPAKEDKISEDIQKEIESLEKEWVQRVLEGAIFAQIDAERTFEHEKEILLRLVEEKDHRIDDLEQHVMSLEQNFKSSTFSFSSQLVEKNAEINLLLEAWEKITTVDVLKEIEIQEKILMIVELEDDISNLQQKLELQEKTLSLSNQKAEEMEAELEAKQFEIKKVAYQLETKLRNSDAIINELKTEKRNLLEDVMKFSSERENLFGSIGGLCDRISKLSCEDMQLMGTLGRIVQAFENNELGMDLNGDDEIFNSRKENVHSHLSPTIKKFEATPDERSPFRELNN